MLGCLFLGHSSFFTQTFFFDSASTKVWHTLFIYSKRKNITGIQEKESGKLTVGGLFKHLHKDHDLL